MIKSEKNNRKLVNQITLAAICLAIGALFLGLSYVTIFSDFIIIMFVPFLGAVLSLRTDFKGQILFIVGCIAISFIDMQEGFFSFLPNVLMGVAYGDLVKKFSLSFYSFIGALTVSFLVQLVLIYPINFFFKVDLIEVYAKVFNMDRTAFESIFPLFYLLIAFVQTLIAFIVLSSELKKVSKVPESFVKNEFWVLLSLGLLTLIGTIISYFFLKWLSYLLLAYFILTSSYSYVMSFKASKKWEVIYYSVAGGCAFMVSGSFFGFLQVQDFYLSLLPLAFYFYFSGLLMLEYSKRSKADNKPYSEKIDLLKDKQEEE